MYITVNMTNHLAPSSPAPSNAPSVSVDTHWEVDADEWEEYDLSALYDAMQSAPASIEGYDCELDFGIDMDNSDSASVITEICGAFTEFAENQRYYDEHIDEDGENENEILSELFYQYDYNICEAVCSVLYGCTAQELTLDQLFELGRADNWHEVCNRTFTVNGG